MRTLLLSLAIVVGSATASRAMGTSVSASLVAWNDDGSSALLVNGTDHDGDSSTTNTVISANSKQPIAVLVSEVGYVDDAHPRAQQLDAKACFTAVKTLQAALSA